MRGSIALTLDSNSPPPNMARPSLIKTDKTAIGGTLDAYCLGPEGNPHPSAGRQSRGSYRVALLAYGWGRRGLPVSQQNDMEGSMNLLSVVKSLSGKKNEAFVATSVREARSRGSMYPSSKPSARMASTCLLST